MGMIPNQMPGYNMTYPMLPFNQQMMPGYGMPP